MSNFLLSHDLGTGGNKASLFDAAGERIVSVFEAYPTSYPNTGFHQQRPDDWWNAVVKSTHALLDAAKSRGVSETDIVCIAVSGHSLGVVPLDATGQLLCDSVPIWSDSRATREADDFFTRIDPQAWYETTGCGFPPPHYTLFKIEWYRRHEPQLFARFSKVIGTKDFVNFKLTGAIATDHSYASGCGAYNLQRATYDENFLNAAGIASSLLPPIFPSTHILGTLTPDAAATLGLSPKTLVAAGGVDNSCMALGAGCFRSGNTYASLGSSSWIAIADTKPLLNIRTKPYVFTHVVPNQFVSALAIFSSGTTLRWIRDQLCRDLVVRAANEGCDVYDLMVDEASHSPIGASGVLFNPSLGGGTSLDVSPNIRGAFLGLSLANTRGDLIRAGMEGITLNLRLVLDEFRKLTAMGVQMNVVGGGAINKIWRQMYADAMDIRIEKIGIGQDAAALGAAAIAAVGAGLWSDFTPLDSVITSTETSFPNPESVSQYAKLASAFERDREFLGRRVL
ncbi:MAG: xylulokinase [Thermoguttaceae bacterium]